MKKFLLLTLLSFLFLGIKSVSAQDFHCYKAWKKDYKSEKKAWKTHRKMFTDNYRKAVKKYTKSVKKADKSYMKEYSHVYPRNCNSNWHWY